MEYTAGEIKKLIEILRDTELKDLCQHIFPSVYDDFEGKDRSDKNRDLADYVFRYRRVEDLLAEIKGINPNGYHKIINPLQGHQIHDFDLISPMQDCLEQINDNRGLICLLLPCIDDELFMLSFSERLEKELSKQTCVFREKPKIVSTKAGVKIASIGDKIGYKYKELKDDNIAIFPVGINECKRTEDITDFLNHIQEVFEKIPNFCSIIIMFGKDNFSCPPNVICLDTPRFKKYDLNRWINILIQSFIGKHGDKEWKEGWKTAGKDWIDLASEIFSEQDNVKLLASLYEHLKDTLEYLQETPRISSGEFSERVKQDLNRLKEKEYSRG